MGWTEKGRIAMAVSYGLAGVAMFGAVFLFLALAFMWDEESTAMAWWAMASLMIGLLFTLTAVMVGITK